MIRIIFALFPAMVSVFLYGIAIYAKKSEKEFWQNAIRTTGVNLTKSYGDKQYNTKKLLRVVLPNGQTETISSRSFNQIKAIPLGEVLHIAYLPKTAMGMTLYELRILDDVYMKKHRISASCGISIAASISLIVAVFILIL